MGSDDCLLYPGWSVEGPNLVYLVCVHLFLYVYDCNDQMTLPCHLVLT